MGRYARGNRFGGPAGETLVFNVMKAPTAVRPQRMTIGRCRGQRRGDPGADYPIQTRRHPPRLAEQFERMRVPSSLRIDLEKNLRDFRRPAAG